MNKRWICKITYPVALFQCCMFVAMLSPTELLAENRKKETVQENPTGNYTWKDSSGRIFFGSKPPKNALDVKKVSAPPISRYSSDKVISGFGVKNKKSISDARASLGLKGLEPIVEKSIKSAKDNIKLKGKPPHLKYEEPKLTLNDLSEVTACDVSIKNQGKSEATDIVVQLTFPDGTFISAQGPEKLKAEEKATYSLPANSVPLRLSTKSGEKLSLDTAKPEVMVSYN